MHYVDSHLLSTDDTLFFCKLEASNLGFPRCTPLLFEAVSDLRVNLSKSAPIPIEVPQLLHLVYFFGCGLECLPSSCLGLPLKAPYECKAIKEPIVERFHKRIAK